MLLIIDVFHVSALNKRDLTIIENDTHLINADLVICVIERNTLLALSTRELITRDRVILRENNLITHHTEYS